MWVEIQYSWNLATSYPIAGDDVSSLIRVILLSICMFMFLSGCSEDRKEDTRSFPFVMGKTVIYPENEPPYIRIIDGEEIITISDLDDYPSRPQLSPDRAALAYISPYEFEMQGYVWLLEATDREARRIVLPNQLDGDEQSVRRLLWLDDDHLLILSGYTWGTLPDNRNLFTYTLSTDEIREVYQTDDQESILEMSLDGDEVILGIDQNDADSIIQADTTKTLPLSSLLQ